MAAMKRQQPIAPPNASSNPLSWTLEQYLAYYVNLLRHRTNYLKQIIQNK